MDKICILILIVMGFKMKLLPWQIKKPKKVIKLKNRAVSKNGKPDYRKNGKIINIEELRIKNENRARCKPGL